MANTIVDDLTIMNANEWDWWTACSYGTYTDGLIYLDEDNHEISIFQRDITASAIFQNSLKRVR